MKHALATILTLTAATILFTACTSDSGANEIAVERAQSTAEAAIIAHNDAISERDAAIQRADQAEKSANRLAVIKERGDVVCSTGNDTPGFHSLDASGQSVGFDVDLCRAVAAAVLGDADAVEFRFTDLVERGPALQSGEIDLMNLTTTWTSTRDVAWGNFAPVMFYDGQGFMATKASGVTSALQLGGAAVCVTAGTTTELNLADYFRQNNLGYSPTVFEQSDVAFDSYTAGQCDAFTTDRSALASLLTTLPNPDEHLILPEIVYEEPLTPVIPHGDEAWFDVVKIVMAGIIYAEAYGIDSTNVDVMAAGDNVKAKRLLGSEGDFGQEALGLEKTFMQDVIKQVGNYGEIYERNLGTDGIGLPRKGRNDLWINGGQIYAAPLR
ncbi:MAG: transporter substrate-binding domain-containing protein [Chloroflexi bacterium]|nr:transporter substrate-binding domain-containing protein [Chloroflexota bacterium]